MNTRFHFSLGVVVWLGAVFAFGTGAGVIWPSLAIFLGAVGVLVSMAAQLALQIRGRRWRLSELRNLPPLTYGEGIIGSSGMALFLATVAAVVISSLRHAA